ncbi:hypothetical protein ACTXT7_010537 [Hymenolepis weldensis]
MSIIPHIYLVAHFSFSSPHIDDVCYSDQVGSTVIARYHCGCALVYYSPAACVLKLREEELAVCKVTAPLTYNARFLFNFSPQTYAWQGGALLASNAEDHSQYLVTRKEYEENGHSYCEEKFPVT